MQSTLESKMASMEPFRNELEAVGVDYKPITFSRYGRPHPDSLKLIKGLGKRAARRKGTEAQVEERRMNARIPSEIWHRGRGWSGTVCL